ncbi:Fe-S cluster assembly protein SufD [bacterium]|nr:Fe-S cluster assembly protein SufD [bacterium]NUN44304.1 Fe-S cluster assembly protein SufD [bacterium]
MINQTEAKNWFQNQFARFESALNGQKSGVTHALRRDAMARFQASEFPTMRHEEWKYTNLESLFTHGLHLASPADSASHALDIRDDLTLDTEAYTVVFVNGYYDAKRSTINAPEKGLQIRLLSQCSDEEKAGILRALATETDESVFNTMHMALVSDGVVIDVAGGAVIGKPVHIQYFTVAEESAPMTQPLTLIRVEKNAQCTVIEDYKTVGEKPFLTNARTEIIVAENAVVDHARIQNESVKGYHISLTRLRQARSSNFMTTNITFGAALSRNLTIAHLDGEGIESTLNGLYMPKGRQHTDNRTIIHHAKPHCNSHELYKGIMDDHATAVFNGKIFVHPDAQKTDAKQSNNNLLLSKDATINTKPQLEIFADDVKCTHGATIGRLEEKGMFYLRSRGIGYDEARSIMTLAFAEDIVSRIRHTALRKRLDTMLHERLNMKFE